MKRALTIGAILLSVSLYGSIAIPAILRAPYIDCSAVYVPMVHKHLPAIARCRKFFANLDADSWSFWGMLAAAAVAIAAFVLGRRFSRRTSARSELATAAVVVCLIASAAALGHFMRWVSVNLWLEGTDRQFSELISYFLGPPGLIGFAWVSWQLYRRSKEQMELERLAIERRSNGLVLRDELEDVLHARFREATFVIARIPALRFTAASDRPRVAMHAFLRDFRRSNAPQDLTVNDNATVVELLARAYNLAELTCALLPAMGSESVAVYQEPLAPGENVLFAWCRSDADQKWLAVFLEHGDDFLLRGFDCTDGDGAFVFGVLERELVHLDELQGAIDALQRRKKDVLADIEVCVSNDSWTPEVLRSLLGPGLKLGSAILYAYLSASVSGIEEPSNRMRELIEMLMVEAVNRRLIAADRAQSANEELVKWALELSFQQSRARAPSEITRAGNLG